MQTNVKGKKIILAITGSIGAYKSAFLVRLLVKQGAGVQVVRAGAAPPVRAAARARPRQG